MLTKAQIAMLSVEDQELLANLELRKLRQHEQLVKLVRGQDWRSRYFPFVFSGMVSICAVFYFFNFFGFREFKGLYFVAGMILLGFFGLMFHISRLDRRLNALLELLDFDRQNHDDSNNSKDEKIG